MGETPAENLREIAEIVEKLTEHVEESTETMHNKVLSRYKQVKGSGIGEEHAHNVVKYLDSARRHLAKDEFKQAGVRIGQAVQEAEAITEKLG